MNDIEMCETFARLVGKHTILPAGPNGVPIMEMAEKGKQPMKLEVLKYLNSVATLIKEAEKYCAEPIPNNRFALSYTVQCMPCSGNIFYICTVKAYQMGEDIPYWREEVSTGGHTMPHALILGLTEMAIRIERKYGA